MKKYIMIIAVLLLAGMAYAASLNYEVEKIAVNGIFIENETIAIELGTNVQIDVWVKGLGEKKDVRVKAWIGGYEYEDIEAETEVFEVKGNITYRKELYLEIPRDLDLDNNEHILHIEVYDRQDFIEETYPIFIEERRHDVAVQDVIIRPGTMVDAGRSLSVQVRLENFGQKKESNLKIEAAIPQLGISSVTWLDVLEEYGEDESSASTDFIPLQLPLDAPTGDYQLKVTVFYNRLHSETEMTRLVYVKGVDNEAIAQKESIVAVSSDDKASLGEVAECKIALMNIGGSKKSYSVVVEGITWGTSSVEPESLELMPGTSSEIVISMVPSEVGKQQFTVKVMEDDALVKESLLSINVEEEKEAFSFPSMDKLKEKKNMVLIGMVAVLLIALLITLARGLRPNPEHY